jgi:hypothetical protein
LTQNTNIESISSSFKRDLSVTEDLSLILNKKINRNISTQDSSTTQLSKISSKSYDSKTKTISLSQISKNFKSEIENDVRFKEFTSKIPKWGGNIEVKEEDYDENEKYNEFMAYNNLPITNTCTIDYFLFSFWCSYKFSVKCREIINHESSYIKKIVNLIQDDEWNRAKTIWILTNNIIRSSSDWTFSTFGTEFNFFVKFIISTQEHKITCNNFNCKNATQSFSNKELQFIKKNNYCNLNVCDLCNIHLMNNPFCLFIECLKTNSDTIEIIDLPPVLIIDNKRFQLLCFTFFKDNHFRSIFYINKSFYLIDDLKNIVYNKISCKPDISYCVYYLV